MKKVFVLGGTGFLGYHTIKQLLHKGYEVAEISLPPMPANHLFPSEVKSYQGDLTSYTDEQILALLSGVYAFVYAAGADERTVPPAPASAFFYQANVLPTQRMARLAKQAGVKKFVIFNSYFSHWAEQWTDLKLNKEQAYPRTRLLQEELAMLEGAGQMDVMSLRLPYIFGTMPGRTPLWTMFLDRVKDQDIVYAPAGGTAVVTVQQVAEAAVGAIEHGQHEGRYAIGNTNMKHKEFYQHIANALQQPHTKIVTVPLEILQPTMKQLDEQTASIGKEHGIHLEITAEIQDRDAFIDPAQTMAVLRYEEADVITSLMETLEACVKTIE